MEVYAYEIILFQILFVPFKQNFNLPMPVVRLLYFPFEYFITVNNCYHAKQVFRYSH